MTTILSKVDTAAFSIFRLTGIIRAICICATLGIPSAALLGAEIGNRKDDRGPRYREDRILAKPKQGVAAVNVERLRVRHGGKIIRRYARMGNVEVIEIKKEQGVSATINALKESGLFEYVEPDHLLQTFVTPNDTFFTNQWGLHNTGQSGGLADADIDAPEGWDIQTNATDVIVAVVDTGMRLNHEDLITNLWVNPGETADGVDNDGNGYIDDIHGINAINGSGNPADDVGHGTHVAGIIGARGNNGVGISGVAWEVKLMPLKFLSPFGGSTSDAIECLNYALAKGAKIVNASWGSHAYSQALYDAIDTLRTNGVILVAASGNHSINLDSSFVYPAGYNLDNVVSVNATTRSNTLVFFSNHGYLASDLGAPGADIYSTFSSTNTPYVTQSGTSMAAPHVVGALALLRSRLPAEHYLGAIYRLLGNVEVTPALRGRCLSDGQLNLHKLLYDSAVSSPINDHFTNRTSVPGSQWTRFGRSVGAGKETSEPNHAGHTGGGSIWWTWTAPHSGSVELTTAKSFGTNGGALNTLLAVYTGTSVGGLTEIASNDDGGLIDDGTNASRVTFSATANTSYQIAVDSRDAAPGYVRLALAYAPRNDSLTTSYKLNGLYIASEGWNLGATKESNEVAHAGNVGGRSLWWSWRAPITGDFALTTEGSNFDTLLGVYTGSSHPLTLVATNNDDTSTLTKDDYGAKTSGLIFSAIEGQTYHIVVDGFNSQPGHIFLAGGYRLAVKPIARTLGTVKSDRDRINASNEMCGPWVDLNSSLTKAYSYNFHTEVFTDIGPWQVTNHTYGIDLNNKGQLVGFTTGPGGFSGSHAIAWDSIGGLRRLDNSNAFSQAYGISKDGLIGGSYTAASGFGRASYWLSNQIYDLPLPFAGDESGVTDVSESGTMIGSIATPAPNITRTGLLWRDVPGAVSVAQLTHRLRPSSFPEAINDRGEIAGDSDTRAVVWVEKRPKMAAHFGFSSKAWGLNNLGQVVATALKFKWDNFYDVPYISQNGVDLLLERLRPEGWTTLSIARSINDNGVMVGRGNHEIQGFVSCAMSPPAVIMLRAPTLLSNNYFVVGLAGPSNAVCDVEANIDLMTTNWVNLGNVTLTGGWAQFTDTNAPSYSNRFYRAKSGSKLSGNAAGYMIRAVPAGQSMVANPFHCADNRLNALIPVAPQDTTVWKFDPQTQGYRDANTYFTDYGWYPDSEMTLNPGEGAIIDAINGGFTNRWVGLVPQNLLRSDVLRASQIVGSQTAVSGQVDTALGLVFAHGDVVSIMTSTDGSYTSHTNLWGSWSPSAPVVKLGEAFWTSRTDPTVWRQNLSVW